MKSILTMLASVLLYASVSAQSVDEVIAKHIDAIGGRDNWKKVSSIKAEASLSVQGTDVAVTLYMVHNKAMKQVINVMNMEGYVLMTEKEGWTFMPFMGQSAPEAMPAEQLKAGVDELDLQGDLLDYKEKGHTAELLGKEDIEGSECFKVKLTRKSGNSSTYFIDSKNYYAVRRTSKMTANGQEIDLTMNMSNFQKLDGGIVYAMTQENSSQPAPVNFTKVEVNPKIDPAVFEVKK